MMSTNKQNCLPKGTISIISSDPPRKDGKIKNLKGSVREK